MKIIPKLETKDLEAMQKSLQSRFTKLTKSFGKGLVNALKGGGIAGIALGLIDKLLNPLKEVQEAIDKTLKSSDDISTFAKQFDTTSGKLFKLVQLGKSAGLDQDNLFTLIQKYQSAVAEARANPNNEAVSSVRNFVDQKDTAEGFFGFIRQLQTLTKDQQVLVQQQIFGEKQILKMADFLQTDFDKAASSVGIDKVTSQKLTNSIEKLAGLNDLADALEARRGTFDIVNKANVMNEGIVRSRDEAAKIALKKENAQIQSYNDLAAISNTVEKIMGVVNEGIILVGKLVNKVTPFVDKVTGFIDKLAKSPSLRGFTKMFGGGE